LLLLIAKHLIGSRTINKSQEYIFFLSFLSNCASWKSGGIEEEEKDLMKTLLDAS